MYVPAAGDSHVGLVWSRWEISLSDVNILEVNILMVGNLDVDILL
jgi:hypothetical protein